MSQERTSPKEEEGCWWSLECEQHTRFVSIPWCTGMSLQMFARSMEAMSSNEFYRE
jgi:hypothetical protein